MNGSKSNVCENKELQKLPFLILGTYQIKTYDDVTNALDSALAAGYRAFDTAAVYRNEEYIGDCLPGLLEKYKLKREDIFITTKLGPKDLSAQNSSQALDSSLSKLKIDYVDLYLIHWPGKQGLQQSNPLNQQYRREAWLALEHIYKFSKKIKYLGVSNYTYRHLVELLGYATIFPHVLQNEFHPDYSDERVLSLCQEHNINFQAYSPLGASKLLNDKRFFKFSTKYNKTVPQILLKWALQKGCSVIPKSKTHLHIFENIQVSDFQISNADMKSISALGQNTKYCWDPESVF